MADNLPTAAAEGGPGDSPPGRYGRPPISLPDHFPPQQQESDGPIDATTNHGFQLHQMAAGAEEESKPSNVFILDSGATVHATSDETLLLGPRHLGPGDAASLTRRDGQILCALLVGLLRLGTSFYLAEVHYFPGLPPASTLVSVHQLTRRGFSVMFCGADCFVRDRSTGAVVGKGQLRDEDGFYHLDYLRIPIS